MNLIQVPLDGRLGQELQNALSKRPIDEQIGAGARNATFFFE